MLNPRAVTSAAAAASNYRNPFMASDRQKPIKTVVNVPGPTSSSNISRNSQSISGFESKPFIHPTPRGIDEIDGPTKMKKICLNSGRANLLSTIIKKQECDCINCTEYHNVKKALAAKAKEENDKARDGWLANIFDDAMSGIDDDDRQNVHSTTKDDDVADGSDRRKHTSSSSLV
jgi:hypothetical protein